MVSFLYKGKAIGHKYYIENCLKPFVNKIWKQTESLDSKSTKLLDDHRCLDTHPMLLIV
jgi:hypothetical protein